MIFNTWLKVNLFACQEELKTANLRKIMPNIHV